MCFLRQNVVAGVHLLQCYPFGLFFFTKNAEQKMPLYYNIVWFTSKHILFYNESQLDYLEENYQKDFNYIKEN